MNTHHTDKNIQEHLVDPRESVFVSGKEFSQVCPVQ